MPEVGDVLAEKYRLVGLLGEGGMGQVFEARHERIGKRLAVKTLLPAFAENAEAVERFTREAEAAGAVGHPGIIDIHDIGTAEDGSVFLVMEYLEGQSLGELLQTAGRLDPPFVAFVACQVLSTLQAAHDKGIVHRDLKPDNIFLVDKGQRLPEVKLLDFGISVMVDRGDATNRLTQTGTVMGTPYYMAPEQAIGRKELDHRVDTYAMGVILYEALTGKPPFVAENVFALAHSILNDPPPLPTNRRPDLSPELEAIVLRAMSKQEPARFQTATELLDALLPFVGDEAEGLLYLGTVHERLSRSGSKPLPATIAVQTGGHGAAQPGTNMAWQSSEGAASAKGGRVALVVALVVVLLAIVGAGTGAALYLSRGRGEPPRPVVEGPAGPTPPSTAHGARGGATPPSPTPAAEVVIVTLTLQGVPEGAQVLLDGAPVVGPVIQRPRSSEPHRIAVQLDGHEPWSVEATFERDLLVPVTLRPAADTPPAEPDAAPEPTRPIAPRPAPPRRPAPRVEPTQPPAKTPPSRTSPRSRFDSTFDD